MIPSVLAHQRLIQNSRYNSVVQQCKQQNFRGCSRLRSPYQFLKQHQYTSRLKYKRTVSSDSRQYQDNASIPTALSQRNSKGSFKYFYLQYFAACLNERSYRYSSLLLLATFPSGFQAVAQLTFLAQLCVVFLGPYIGRVLSSARRAPLLTVVIKVQTFSIWVSSFILAHLLANNPTCQVMSHPLFPLLLMATMLERLTSTLYDVSIERDWVVLLVGMGNQPALARHNSRIRQLDQLAELVGAIGFGFIASIYSGPIAAYAIVLLSVLLLPVQLFGVFQLARKHPDLKRAVRPMYSQTPVLTTPQPNNKSFLTSKSLQSYVKPWNTFFTQPTAPCTIAYIMYFFNIVLADRAGLFTAYLSSLGLSAAVIGLYRAGGALMGLVGTVCTVPMVRAWGLVRAAGVAFTTLLIAISVAASVYMTHLAGLDRVAPLADVADVLVTEVGGTVSSLSAGLADVSVGLWIFMGAVMCARAGVWAVDIIIAQMNQVAVPREDIADVSSIEQSCQNLADVVGLGIANIFSTASLFPYLVYISWGAVLSSFSTFTAWFVAHNGENKFNMAHRRNTALLKLPLSKAQTSTKKESIPGYSA